MDTESGDSQQKSGSKNIEFRVMPNGGGSWYWEIHSRRPRSDDARPSRQ
jgi:hypothetical protein